MNKKDDLHSQQQNATLSTYIFENPSNAPIHK